MRPQFVTVKSNDSHGGNYCGAHGHDMNDADDIDFRYTCTVVTLL